ncbi:MAG: hypothetical protein PHR53_00865 [Bacteroidales bacterium]|nr:hypothetical protein [Bacteroidales bacterium]
MNNIEISLKQKTWNIVAPENFNEVSGDQYLKMAHRLLALSRGSATIFSDIAEILNIKPSVWNQLSVAQRYTVRELVAWMDDPENHPTARQLIDSVTIDGCKLVGCQSSFGNTTWEEFIYADQFLISGRFKECAAVLYRPIRDPYTGETDIRIPFTKYGTDRRLPLFSKLDETTLFAIILNYRMMRRVSIEERYKNVFPSYMSGNDSETQEPADSNSGNFSWVNVHRTLLGENYFNENQYLQLNVHTVLHRMNEVIESNKNMKNGK